VPALLLGVTKPVVAVPAALNMDEVGSEVDVVPVEGLEFSEAEAGVEGGGVDRPVCGVEGIEEGFDLGGRGDVVAAAADGGEGEAGGGVGGDVAAVVCAPVDRAEGEDRVAHAARREPLGVAVVGEVLERVPADRGEASVAEGGEDAVVECLAVGADRRGLEWVAGAGSDEASLCRFQPFVCRLAERDLGGGAEGALAERDLALFAPEARLAECPERFPDRLVLGRRPDLRLVTRLTRTRLASS
jgi:hypothetical protein